MKQSYYTSAVGLLVTALLVSCKGVGEGKVPTNYEGIIRRDLVTQDCNYEVVAAPFDTAYHIAVLVDGSTRWINSDNEGPFDDDSAEIVRSAGCPNTVQELLVEISRGGVTDRYRYSDCKSHGDDRFSCKRSVEN